MNPNSPTVRAILARFNGDASAAHKYCVAISDTAANLHLRNEYQSLAITIYGAYVMHAEGACA